MPSKPPAAMSERLGQVLRALDDALDAARVDDPATVEAVLGCVAALRGASAELELAPERFPEVRSRLDGTMLRFQRLLDALAAERDGVGRELAKVRQRRRTTANEHHAGGSRLDLTR